LFVLLVSVACGSAPAPQGAVVRFYYFYGETCPHCHEVSQNFLPKVYQKYGASVEHQDLEVWNDPAKYKLMLDLEAKLGVPETDRGSVPALIIGNRVLIGSAQIPNELEGLMDRYLAAGGVDYPSLANLPSTPTPGPTPLAGRQVYLAYFYTTGCQDCDRVALDLRYVEQTYPQVKIARFDIAENQALAEWLGEKLGVPSQERLASPAVFVGSEYLAGDRLVLSNLEAAVQENLPTGTEAVWEQFTSQGQQQAQESLIQRYKSLGALTVVGAGLVNGLNPCAFVTIVFFLSYLTFMGRRGREILLVGAMFTLGVFLAYLLAGLGLSRLLQPLAGVQAALKTWVFALTALLCLALAGVSLHDYIKARQGKPGEMKLKMSLDVRRQVNRVIREGSKMRAFYLVAFLVGAAVSLIQLTCTSPIYVGILFLIHDVPQMQSNALLYLLLYNLAYVVPLVAIFLFAFYGTSSEQLGKFITQRTPLIKALTVLVFLVLAGWLVYSLIALHGVA
jgi:cytochrome c biogenesis protein CcdA/thiol-disulfide isomerase/thioredoxin